MLHSWDADHQIKSPPPHIHSPDSCFQPTSVACVEVFNLVPTFTESTNCLQNPSVISSTALNEKKTPKKTKKHLAVMFRGITRHWRLALLTYPGRIRACWTAACTPAACGNPRMTRRISNQHRRGPESARPVLRNQTEPGNLLLRHRQREI